MESIIIIIAGLIFGILSKSVKDKKEIEKEKQKRKEQLQGREQHTSVSYDTGTRKKAKTNNRSLKDIFMEEINKLEGEEGGLGDILKKSFNTEDEVEHSNMESSETTYGSESDYISEQEYLEKKGYQDKREPLAESYRSESSSIEDHREITQGMEGSPNSKKTSKSKKQEIVKGTVKDKPQYSPFTKSLNREDVIRGVIFSEVLGKPKSLRNEKRSM